MTDELDTLRPEVRDALEVCDRDLPQTWHSQTTQWGVIRAELLRLAVRNAELEAKATRDHDWKEMYERAKKAEAELAEARKNETVALGLWNAAEGRATKAESELAALKARIAEAKRVRLGTYPAHGSGYVQIIAEPREGDKTYRLLVDEPPAERGDR